MQYRVRSVRSGDQAVRDEVLEAADDQALRAALAADAAVVLDIRPARQSPTRWRSKPRYDYALFCREVRTLIRAGMTVVEAVDTLCARNGAAQRHPGLVDLLQGNLQQGQSLSHSLAALPRVPPVLVAAVRAGERTSNLGEALDDYLRFDELMQRLHRKVVSAALYPALVTSLGIAIALFLLTVVMPGFSRMYNNLRGRSSGLSAGIIDLSQWVAQHHAQTIAILVSAAVALALWIGSGEARRFLTRVALAVPPIRKSIEDFQLAMLYQALALLLKGGYPLVQAIEVGGQSVLGTHLAGALNRARQRITEGSLVSHSLAAEGLCDEVDRRLMAAAERNGDFHLAAEVVAQLHGERFELFIERTTRIVEPVLLLGVALFVGAIVVAMYLPIFDMATRLR